MDGAVVISKEEEKQFPLIAFAVDVILKITEGKWWKFGLMTHLFSKQSHVDDISLLRSIKDNSDERIQNPSTKFVPNADY